MTVAIRVIPCLDVDAGRVVKGVNFEGLRDAGDPVELAKRYNAAGADELTFLDVTASSGNRETTYRRGRQDRRGNLHPADRRRRRARASRTSTACCAAGADKASINTAAVARPEVINEITQRFGSQVLVLSLDARRTDNPDVASGFEVTTHGGRTGTGLDAVAWAKEAAERGVGEILLNSIDADGTKDGFDLEMIRAVRAAVTVPLIASGGAGGPEHFPPAIAAGADAVLAASIFHFGPDDMIKQVKDAIREAGYPVR